MWPAFPTAEYYGGSATTRRHQRTLRLPVRLLAADDEGDTGSLPTFTRDRLLGSLPSSTPTASPGPHTAVLDRTSRRPHITGDGSGPRIRGPAPQHSPSVRFDRLLASDGASTTGSLSLHLPTLLAGTRRLTVPTCPYVVSAAPGLTRSSGLDLRSASHRPLRRPAAGIPARTILSGASWRTLRHPRRRTRRTRRRHPPRPAQRAALSTPPPHRLPSQTHQQAARMSTTTLAG